jgi:hypothetical protein
MTTVITPTELRQIFTTELPDDGLSVFCDTAADIVDEKLAGSGLSDARIKRVGLFLAAHLASSNSPVPQSENISGVSYTRQGQTGMGLDSTYYGQMAKTLDTSGKLSTLGKRLASVTVIGEP